MTPLSLAPEHLRQPLAHARYRSEEECCGALLGRAVGEERWVSRVVATGNDHPGDRRCRYRIPPRDLLDIHRTARGDGLEVVGYYHSHPGGSALPSAVDRREAWPGVSYLIVGAGEQRAAEVRSWRLREETGEFEEEAVRVRSGSVPLEGRKV